MVLRRCRQLLKDDVRARDAMQDVFIKMLSKQNGSQIMFPTSLIFRISTNVCLNMLRDQKSHRSLDDKDIVESIAAYDDSEDKFMMRDFLARIFRKEKPSTREMAVLYYLDEMTFKEVAQETGFSVSGVRKRLREFKKRVNLMKDFSNE